MLACKEAERGDSSWQLILAPGSFELLMPQKQKFSQEPRGPPRHLFGCVFSVMSHSLWSHGLEPTKLLCLWDFSGKNTGTGCHFLLQGFFPTQGSISCILCPLHCRWILYPKPPGKPLIVSFTVGEVEKITGGAVSGSDSSLTESLTFAKKHHIEVVIPHKGNAACLMEEGS